MAVTSYEFTTDEEMKAFMQYDKGMELTGYVDCIDGIKTVRTPQAHVLKFVLNNASNSRIRVLIWGTKDAKQYESVIKMGLILHITNGTLGLSNEQFRNRNEKISLLEFHVQSSSVITPHGLYESPTASGPQPEISFPAISLEDVMLQDGPVEIKDAYLKIPFIRVHTGNSTYGQGTVVDGHYRLTVQVANFGGAMDTIAKGTHLKLRGIMNKQPGGCFKVADADAIDVVEDNIMSRQELKLSIHSVLLVRTKRPRNQEEKDHKMALELQKDVDDGA